MISDRFFVERAALVQQGMSPLVLAMKKAYEEEHFVDNTERKLKSSYYDDSKNRPGDDVILTLIEKGADMSVGLEAFKMTPLMCALNYKRGYEVIHRLICLEPDINAKCCDNKTALIYAVWNNYGAAVIGEIISRGAVVDCDVLNVAVYVNKPEIVKLLIDAKADGVDLDASEKSVFLQVNCNCRKGDTCTCKETIDTLVERGFDVAKIDSEGNTIIHGVSCSYLISLVIKYGFSVDTENRNGLSPLFMAISYEDVDKINCLLMWGANPDCLDFAMDENSSEEIVNLLVYNEANITVKLVKSFLAHSCPVHLVDYLSYITYKQSNLAILKNYYLFFDGYGFSEEEFTYFFQYTDEEKKFCRIFFTECKQEISKMHEMFIADGVSFYQFCMMRKVKRSKCVNIPPVALKYDYEQVRDLFPVFENIIILRMENNRKQYLRRVLRKAVEKITIRPVLEDGADSCVNFNYDCMYYLSSYLNNKDLYKLFRLSVDPDTVSVNRTSDMIFIRYFANIDFPRYLKGAI